MQQLPPQTLCRKNQRYISEAMIDLIGITKSYTLHSIHVRTRCSGNSDNFLILKVSQQTGRSRCVNHNMT